MLNLREGHVFVELNYPHIIGISGYERHHVVATWPGVIRAEPVQAIYRRLVPMTCTNRAKSRRQDSGQTMAKQGQTSNQGLEGNHGLEGLTVAANEAAK